MNTKSKQQFFLVCLVTFIHILWHVFREYIQAFFSMNQLLNAFFISQFIIQLLCLFLLAIFLGKATLAKNKIAWLYLGLFLFNLILSLSVY